MNPVVLEPFAERFDKLILKTLLKLLDIERVDEKALRQVYLPLKHGGCGVPLHSLAALSKFYISAALLIAPIVDAATGFSLGSAAPRTVRDAASQYFDSVAPSELCLRM